jgi:hypothetical protein
MSIRVEYVLKKSSVGINVIKNKDMGKSKEDGTVPAEPTKLVNVFKRRILYLPSRAKK